MTPSPPPPRPWVAILVAALLADQLTKTLAFMGTSELLLAANVEGASPPTLDLGIVSIQARVNWRGNFDTPLLSTARILGALAILTAGIGGAWLHRAKIDAPCSLIHLWIALLLAGGAGNGLDRVIYGGVRDFIRVVPGLTLPGDLSWWFGSKLVFPFVFNVADIWLLLAFLGLAKELFRPSNPPLRQPGP